MANSDTRFHLVGHDWGGPTAYALAAAHPEAVSRLVIVDVVIPGDGGDFSQGGRRWHHQFHATPDLPEALTIGRERTYLTWFYRTFGHRPDAITQADIDEYLRTYTQPGAMCAGFNYYRALPRTLLTTRGSCSNSSCPCLCSPLAARAAGGVRRSRNNPCGASPITCAARLSPTADTGSPRSSPSTSRDY